MSAHIYYLALLLLLTDNSDCNVHRCSDIIAQLLTIDWTQVLCLDQHTLSWPWFFSWSLTAVEN